MASLLLGCMEFYDLWVRSGSQELNRAEVELEGMCRAFFLPLAACRLPLGYFFIFFSFFFFCYWKWRHRNCCTFCGIAIGAAAGQRDKWVLHISQALKRVEPWVMSWCKDEGGGRRVASGATMTFSAAASICQGTANWSDGLWSLQQQMPSKSRQLTPYSPPWRHPALTTSKRN